MTIIEQDSPDSFKFKETKNFKKHFSTQLRVSVFRKQSSNASNSKIRKFSEGSSPLKNWGMKFRANTEQTE